MALLLIALVLLLLLSLPRHGGYDALTFLAINRRRAPWLIELSLRIVSHLGLLPTNVALWSSLAVLIEGPTGIAASAIGGGGMLAAWAACRVIKHLTARPRPFTAIDGARLVGLTPSGSSFPSSHAALAFYSAAALSHILDWTSPAVLLAYTAAAMVGLLRVYLGAHYPRDVLAGTALGLASAIVAARLFDAYG